MATKASFLDVNFKHQQGSLALNISFSLSAPWTVLFGPSGSGKTTILRTVSGLLQPTSGCVILQSQTLLDTATRVRMPPYQRPIRCASQSARLFPHLTVEQNLRYGLTQPDSQQSQIAAVKDLFRIAPLSRKLPSALSGGEQQRVSFARAVASGLSAPGALLLLDEPFAGLDLQLRDTLAVNLKEWLALHKTPVLSVTHDVGEAFLLGAEILRLHDGRITEQGPVRTVLAPERQRILNQLGQDSSAS